MEGTKWEVRMGLIFTPVLVRHLLGPLGLSGSMTSISWTYTYLLQTVLLKGITCLWLPTPYTRNP